MPADAPGLLANLQAGLLAPVAVPLQDVFLLVELLELRLYVLLELCQKLRVVHDGFDFFFVLFILSLPRFSLVAELREFRERSE